MKEKKHFRIQSYTFVAPHWCTLKSLFSIVLTRVLQYIPDMLNANVNRLSVTLTHCEFRQTVHAILFVAGCDWRLLVRWFTVQVAVGEGLHWTHPLPYPSLHLMLVDGQIKVLSLERNDTRWCAAQSYGTRTYWHILKNIIKIKKLYILIWEKVIVIFIQEHVTKIYW